MAHYIHPSDQLTKRGSKRFSLPKINGRVGFSFYVGTKEIFIGIAIADVILEQIIKKRIVKIPKAETRTYGFDPFSSDN
jgi:hypothetical protein